MKESINQSIESRRQTRKEKLADTMPLCLLYPYEFTTLFQ